MKATINGCEVYVESVSDAVHDGNVLHAGAQEAVQDVSEKVLKNSLSELVKNHIVDISKSIASIDTPTEFEVQFSIKASVEMGAFVVGKVGAEANYSVRLLWKKQT